MSTLRFPTVPLPRHLASPTSHLFPSKLSAHRAISHCHTPPDECFPCVSQNHFSVHSPCSFFTISNTGDWRASRKKMWKMISPCMSQMRINKNNKCIENIRPCSLTLIKTKKRKGSYHHLCHSCRYFPHIFRLPSYPPHCVGRPPQLTLTRITWGRIWGGGRRKIWGK